MVQQATIAQVPWVCRLRPAAPVAARSSVPAELRARALEELEDGPVAWATEVAVALRSEMQRSVADLGGGPTAFRGVETELLCLLLQLKDVCPTSELEVPDASIEDARALARGGVPPGVLTEAVWRLHVRVQEAMLAVLARLRGTGVEAAFDDRLRDDILRLTRYSELAARVLLAAYDGEAEAWSEDRALRRRDAIGRLVQGDRLTAAEEELVGLRLTGFHLVATVIGSPLIGDDDPRLVQLAKAVAGRVPGCSLVTTPLETETLLWWSRARAIDAGDVDRVRRIAVPEGLTVTFGEPHAGPDGVALGYAEARRAATVARAAAAVPGPWMHADVLLAAALLADPEATEVLVRRELAGVLGRDRRSTELRRTVLEFLRSGGSRQAVSRELDVAPTTVAYRVERFEHLRGWPLHATRLETWVALAVVDLVPSILSGSAE